ncbi:MAG: hypothetical protein M3Y32_01785 [Pseudomonadota bacterium]|nr:hypothetical protein [Pseudomonadota bacterium]
MISAFNSSLSTVRSKGGNSETALAELSKQFRTLQQQLVHSQDAGSVSPASTGVAALSREIVTVQAQIERVILAAQLSKLQSANETGAGDSSNATMDPGKKEEPGTVIKPAMAAHDRAAASSVSTGKHDDPAVRRSAAQSYHLQKPQGSYVDAKA